MTPRRPAELFDADRRQAAPAVRPCETCAGLRADLATARSGVEFWTRAHVRATARNRSTLLVGILIGATIGAGLVLTYFGTRA